MRCGYRPPLVAVAPLVEPPASAVEPPASAVEPLASAEEPLTPAELEPLESDRHRQPGDSDR